MPTDAAEETRCLHGPEGPTIAARGAAPSPSGLPLLDPGATAAEAG